MDIYATVGQDSSRSEWLRRALTSAARDATESIATTNAALGIEATLTSTNAREPAHP